MDSHTAIDLTSEAINLVLLLAAPVFLTVLVVGLVTSLVQTVTQIQDPSLSQVPKLIAVALVLALTLPWIIGRLVEFSHGVLGGAAHGLVGG